MRRCGLTSPGAHRASHGAAAPAGSRWRPDPLRTPPPRADHAVPAGAAARGQLHRPHRGQHRHCLVLDGVYRRSADGSPATIEAASPNDDELHALLQSVIERLLKLITRRAEDADRPGSDAARGVARLEPPEPRRRSKTPPPKAATPNRSRGGAARRFSAAPSESGPTLII